jgi:hypothetical protein
MTLVSIRSEPTRCVQGRMFASVVSSTRTSVRIVGAVRETPPVVRYRRRLPFGIGINAINRTGWKTLVAPAAQLGDDDDIGAVVEDRTEVRRAGTQARVAVDALGHFDSHRQAAPLLVARPS